MMALMKLECNFLKSSEASDSQRPRICSLYNSIQMQLYDFLISLVEFTLLAFGKLHLNFINTILTYFRNNVLT